MIEPDFTIAAPDKEPGANFENFEMPDNSEVIESLAVIDNAQDDEAHETEEPGYLEIARYDPLRAYMAEISKFISLGREEERELAEKYRSTGDRESAYRLVTSQRRHALHRYASYDGRGRR